MDFRFVSPFAKQCLVSRLICIPHQHFANSKLLKGNFTLNWNVPIVFPDLRASCNIFQSTLFHIPTVAMCKTKVLQGKKTHLFPSSLCGVIQEPWGSNRTQNSNVASLFLAMTSTVGLPAAALRTQNKVVDLYKLLEVAMHRLLYSCFFRVIFDTTAHKKRRTQCVASEWVSEWLSERQDRKNLVHVHRNSPESQIWYVTKDTELTLTVNRTGRELS